MTKFYMIMDTETGGLSALENTLTEIAIGIYNHTGELVDRFHSFLNIESQQKTTSLYALKLSSYFERNDQSAEIENHHVASQLAKWLIGVSKEFNPTIVGHNIKFDLEFLNNFMDDHGFSKPFEIFSPHTIDTITIAKLLSIKGLIQSTKMNLATLCQEFQITNDAAHTAMADVEATAKLLFKLLDLIH